MQTPIKEVDGNITIRGPLFSLGLLMAIIIVGSIGFMMIEGYSLTDAVYMTIITMATVGFREVKTLSDPGKWFTIFLIISSIGIFAYAVGSFSRYIVDGIFTNQYKLKRVKKKIQNFKDHVIVVGYGRNGSQATKELAAHSQNTLVIDQSDKAITRIQNDGFIHIKGDATKDEVLQEANIHSARALITALPKDADNLYVVLTASEMNPDLKIISRASGFRSEKKLKRAGATNVIMPDKLGGQHMANLVAQPDIVEFLDSIMLQHSKEVRLEEISCSGLNRYFENRSIGDLDIRHKIGANIIGIRLEDGSYKFNPEASTLISPKDQLFVLGSVSQIKLLKELLENGK